MFAFPSFNTEKDVIAYKSFMLADRMEAQWSQNSQNVLLLMVFTNFTLLQFHELFSQISNFAANLNIQFLHYLLQFHELFSQRGYHIGNMKIDKGGDSPVFEIGS